MRRRFSASDVLKRLLTPAATRSHCLAPVAPHCSILTHELGFVTVLIFCVQEDWEAKKAFVNTARVHTMDRLNQQKVCC
eukprot:1956103-Amphidinium_carterae.3